MSIYENHWLPGSTTCGSGTTSTIVTEGSGTEMELNPIKMPKEWKEDRMTPVDWLKAAKAVEIEWKEDKMATARDWEAEESYREAYNRDILDGIKRSYLDTLSRLCLESMKVGEPLFLMGALTKEKKGDVRYDDKWSFKLVETGSGAWDLATRNEVQEANKPEEESKMVNKLFEVFLVTSEGAEVQRKLTWGKDQQEVREKAIIEFGLSVEEYGQCQVVTKFISEFEFPDDESED